MPTDSESHFSVGEKKMWSCHNMFICHRHCSTIFLEKLLKVVKSMFPKFVMPWNKMQNRDWVTEGASIFPLIGMLRQSIDLELRWG